MSDAPSPAARTCEWCGNPMTHDGRAVCPTCGRLASRLAAMDEPEPVAPDPPADQAPATPPPPAPAPAPAPPTAPTPAPTPAPPTAPSAPRPGSTTGPVAPGDRWPTPAPLPPDEEGRTGPKVAVAVIAVLAVAGIAAAVFFGVTRGGSSGPTAAAPTNKVDLSDVDDPAVTTTRPATTTTEATSTTVVRSDGRIGVASASGITWSMANPPDVEDTVGSHGTDDVVGRSWTAEGPHASTELVEVDQLDGATFDADAALADLAERFDGRLGPVEESHIEEAPGRTASFTGTADGEAIAGYVVAAQVGDESLVVAMWRQTDDVEGVYLDFLPLPSSVTLP